jgi:predicted TIM-barrel fold metal-dependent hydrolase
VTTTGFDVIDAHQHYGSIYESMGGLEAAMPAQTPEEFEATELSTRLGVLDERGVRQTVIIGSHSYLRPEGLADTRRINDGVMAYLERAPSRFAAGVGVVEPLYGRAGLPEIDRCQEIGMVGISFHGRFQGVSHDAPWVHRFIERIGELGMVPFLHAPAESPEESLWKAAALADDFPDLTILVLDAFSGFESAREAVRVADRCPNLVFDTALAFDFHFIMPMVRQCGPSRLVYGSDLYSWPSGAYGGGGLSQILDSELDDEAKAAIVGGNFRRILEGVNAAHRG